MQSILKIIGTEIWVGSFLFSSGLERPAYAAKLREAEELEAAVHKALKDEYDVNSRITTLECEMAELERDLCDAEDEKESLQIEVDSLRRLLDVNGVEIPGQ